MRKFAPLLILLPACSNPCQELCSELADYAEECGISVSGDQISQCEDDHSNDLLRPGEAETCDEYFGDVRDEWTCDDISNYF